MGLDVRVGDAGSHSASSIVTEIRYNPGTNYRTSLTWYQHSGGLLLLRTLTAVGWNTLTEHFYGIPTENEWYFIEMAVKGDNIWAYINGDLVAFGTDTNLPSSGQLRYVVGGVDGYTDLDRKSVV